MILDQQMRYGCIADVAQRGVAAGFAEGQEAPYGRT
jgi:hypothetical protein